MFGSAQEIDSPLAAGAWMSAPGNPIMHNFFRIPMRPPNAGYVTVATLVLAASSAALLVLMSGCHATAATHGFVSIPAEKAVAVRSPPADTLAPLQPFDEGFVVAASDTN
jgi:hypothetical protein